MLRRSLLTGTGVGLAALGMGAAAAAAPEEGHPIVIGRGHDLPSRILGQTRRINVWLPPSYGDGKSSYPILCLMDGGEGEDFHHISGLTQVGAMNGYLREMIVIGVADMDRRHDLTFPTNNAKDRKDFPTTGGSAAFRAFIGDELMPWIKSRYRTTGEAALIGESLGGLFTVETYLATPAMFDTYIAVSPSLWWDDGSLQKRAGAMLAAQDAKVLASRRLWLTVGNEGDEMLTGLQMINTAALGLSQVTYKPLPLEKHDRILHPAAGLALRDLYLAPPPART
ncbi:MAG: hypothetical protein JWP35_4599 [Caulobacter sp.]|nr:hypothetical protein [Caulobacter sp.]